MKLHLPTALFALAVLPAVAAPEDNNPGFIIDEYKEQYQKITKDDYTTDDGRIYLGADTLGYTESVDCVTPDSKSVAIIEEEQLELVDGYYSLSLGAGDKIDGKGTNSKAPKVLYIEGNLNLSDGAYVHTDGHKKAYVKGGIVADHVTVSGGTLATGGALFDSLTVRSGIVALRAGTKNSDGTDISYTNGGTIYGPGHDFAEMGVCPPEYNSYFKNKFEFSNVGISGGITVEGGDVTIGRDFNGSSESYYLGDVGNTSTYYQSSIGGKINQSGGTLDMRGHTYLYTSEINQTGGTMTVAAADANNGNTAKYLRIDSDSMKVTQGSAPENANAPILNLQGIIVSGSNGDGSLKLEIEQKGNGIINMETTQVSYLAKGGAIYEKVSDHIGSYFTTADDGPASVIKQSGSGTININSDYTSATFNVEQTGKGGKITIGVNGKLKSDALTLTDASTFTIASSKNGGLTLNKDAEVTFAISSLVSTNTGGLVVENGNNFIAEGGDLVSVKVVFSDDVVMSALTELTSAENQVFGTNDWVLIATGDVSKALTFSTVPYEKEYDLGNGTTATVEFAYDFKNEGNQVFANVTATVTGTGTTPAVPEPATATLSLLALAGLCARRRRK